MARDPTPDLAEFTEPELVQITQDVLDRIEEDRRRRASSVQVSDLLTGIKRLDKGLLDSDLQVQDLLNEADCGKNASTRFAEQLGLGPWEYITLRRMDIAIYALIETDLKVWQIAMCCGYASADALSDAFLRYTGKRPTAFRKAARADDGWPKTLVAPADLVDQEKIRRDLGGDLEAGPAAAVAGGLGALNDQVRANYRALDPPVPYSEPAKARGLWQYLVHCTPEEQLKAVETHAAEFKTPALFNRLCTEAIGVGVDDDVHGLQLATLAIHSLDPILGRLPEPLGLSYFARAYAVAGNAYLRSRKRQDAEEALAIAYRALDAAGAGAHPLVVAELYLYLCCFEIDRDRFPEATSYLEMGIKVWKAFLSKLEEQQTGK